MSEEEGLFDCIRSFSGQRYESNTFETGVWSKFGVCMGIGFGDVLRSRSEGVFGNEMNLASKPGEDLAGKGEVLLTESAYQEISEEYRTDVIARKANISGVELSYYIILGAGV